MPRATHRKGFEQSFEPGFRIRKGIAFMNRSFLLRNQLWSNEEGQDVAEYSVMLAVILVIVVGTVRLIGSNAGNIFSQVGSAIQ
jgi:Flp pilus assembly pilin Flp